VVAAISLTIWIAVIFTGRLIGFTTSRAKVAPPSAPDVSIEDIFQAAPAAPPAKSK
jgi:hypothetical protein